MSGLAAQLKKTPLHDFHVKAQAKMAEFGGWEMPIVYSSIIKEHQAARQGVGIFDVSHMGQIFAGGHDAAKFLNHILTNEITAAPRGSAIYAHLTNEKGGVIDDLIVYRMSEKMDLLVVNASRVEDDWQWIQKKATGFNVTLNNESANFGIVAVQGPKALPLVAKLIAQTAAIDRFRVLILPWENHEIIFARTGYTGEDGFELIAENQIIPKLWETLIHIAHKEGIEPFALCGLGARDTLRLEAGYPLWGHELNNETTPLEAGYEWVIKWQKPFFIGRDAIKKQKEEGLKRKIFGLSSDQKGPIPRSGCRVLTNTGKLVGQVTSGSFSPTLAKPIALAFLNKEAWSETDFQIDVNGRILPVKIVPLPFYKRG